MKSSLAEIPAIIGTLFAGGYFGGRIIVDGQAFALIVAPKDGGEFNRVQYNDNYKRIDGAGSLNDGLANTQAMLAAGSKLAKQITDLRIDGHDDWYLPSLDELEVIYRNLKPTKDGNSLYMRSGINLNAVTPTAPYTREFPAQTLAEAFQAGSDQAFEESWYWTSTQYAGTSDCAWVQDFGSGDQHCRFKDGNYRARAVRRLPI